MFGSTNVFFNLILFIFILVYFFIEVQLNYNVALITVVQQKRLSCTYIYWCILVQKESEAV